MSPETLKTAKTELIYSLAVFCAISQVLILVFYLFIFSFSLNDIPPNKAQPKHIEDMLRTIAECTDLQQFQQELKYYARLFDAEKTEPVLGVAYDR